MYCYNLELSLTLYFFFFCCAHKNTVSFICDQICVGVIIEFCLAIVMPSINQILLFLLILYGIPFINRFALQVKTATFYYACLWFFFKGIYYTIWNCLNYNTLENFSKHVIIFIVHSMSLLFIIFLWNNFSFSFFLNKFVLYYRDLATLSISKMFV